MAAPENPDAFWAAQIIGWVVKASGVPLEQIDLRRKLTGEPYNLSVVKVLNLMDDMTKVYKETYGSTITLSQNWRLAHRTAPLGDIVTGFIEVVTNENVGRPKKTGIA